MAVTAVAPTEVGVEVGSVFVSSWGYDQTNVDFYKVVGLTPKGVKVQQWSSATVSDDGGPITYVTAGSGPRMVTVWPKASREELTACGECSAFSTSQYGTPGNASRWCSEHGPREQASPVMLKRLSSYDGGKSVYFSVNSFSSARLWDGEKEYQTGSGWGH